MAGASHRHRTATPAATEEVGEILARDLEPGDLILLEGDLASGKTTLVRGLLRGLGGPADHVTSPTFVLVQSHPCQGGPVRTLHHVDLYRVADSVSALRDIGLEELLSDVEAVVAVEWPPDILPAWLPSGARCWLVRLTATDTAAHEIEIELLDAVTDS